MTRQKSFKTRIRARMRKTGESYLAARHQLIDSAAEPETATPPPPPVAQESVRRSTKRMSDDAVRTGTSRGWDDWFAVLDGWGATAHTHTEIARWLVDEHGVDAWWAQGLSVAYEQERGMRSPAQQVDGGFAASASKTVNVPAERLSEAFTNPELREQWLPAARIAIRTSRAGKSLTADWDDGTSRLSVYFTVKGAAKSQTALQHRRLPDADTAEQMKAYWRSALTALKTLLEA